MKIAHATRASPRRFAFNRDRLRDAEINWLIPWESNRRRTWSKPAAAICSTSSTGSGR